MEPKAGAQIGKKAFIQSVVILFVLMLAAGILTRVIQPGSYQRLIVADREIIDPASFHYMERPDYPIWRWFTAPIEVLWGPDALIIIVIIVFIILIAGAFAVLEKSGILNAALGRLVKTFGGRKYLLLLVISFFFMVLGAFFGLFEEIVPLVPLMIALAYYLGWDALVGLGMSILATNMGFSAAITNPFTIGVAQKLADLPLFSGAAFRIPIFLVIYTLLAFFLVRYARKIDRKPEASMVYAEDQAERQKYHKLDLNALAAPDQNLRPATIWFSVFLVLVIAVLLGAPFISFLTDYSLPLVGLLFFIGGLGAGLLTKMPRREVFGALGQGILGFLPGIPMILMAASVKLIVANGGVMDTLLFNASNWFTNASPVMAAYAIYFLALFIEIFVASAGAKAVLLMPILLPLADLVGVTRQVAVTAYCFGDGFSNMAYPTNPVLLIALGLATIGYAKWMRWTLPLWVAVIVVTAFFLWLAVSIGYGPF